MIPSRRFVLLVALGLLPFVMALVWPAAVLAGLAWNAALVLLLGLDLLRAPRPADLVVAREVEDVVSLASSAPVTLSLEWRGPRALRAAFVDAPPGGFTAEGHSGLLRLEPRSLLRVVYRVTPHARGEHRFGDLHLRLAGPLGLLWRAHVRPLSRTLRAYPDLTALVRHEAALLAGGEAGGLRARRLRGEGREFDALREYVPGDDVRTIDWKATARRGLPVSRDYRPEQNQDVLLLLDCGRHMRPKIGNHTKLDHAVNTALTLAHVALGRGDQVGLVVFDHAVKAYLPPRKGRDQLMRIVDALYRVEPTLTESDYHAAYDALSRRALRRALVVTFTDVLDEEASRELLARTALLRPRHLPVVVTISDSDLLRVAACMPRSAEDAYRRIAASRVVSDHHTVLRQLLNRGALVVDAPARELTAATVQRYLDIKARGRL